MDRARELIKILNDASKFYYQGIGTTNISDYEFDSLYDELKSIEDKTGTVYNDSPTQNVGYSVVSELKKVSHEFKMLSLDKTKEVSELKEFLKDNEALLSWKLDGLTIVLTYDNTKLVSAVTRGNGEIGEDITHNAIMFSNLPKKIAYDKKITIRGEAIILYSEFEKINSSLEDSVKYKNPRNLCSGTVRQLNNEVVKKRNVMFYAFNLVDSPFTEFDNKKENQLKWLESLGFSVCEYKTVTTKNLEEEISYFKSKINLIDFATDGLVLTFDSILYSKSLGETSKFPKDSIAFKWADEAKETTLKDISFNTSRTGLINPVAIFEPVLLEGTTVSRASLHNISILKELKLGIGDTITVYKANMIIPQVAKNLTNSNTFVIPDKCPVCGHDASIVKQVDGEVLFCFNSKCSAQIVQKIAHFASRDAMNIEGFSEETIEKFVENKFLQNYGDIYKLHTFEGEIKNMKGFGVKSFDKLTKAIEKSKNCSLYNVIYGLSINQVGLRNAKLLCNYFKDDIMQIINATEEELINIEGFGQIIASSISTFFRDLENKDLFLSLINLLNINKTEKSENTALNGLTFVITGDLEKFSNRKELQNLIEQMGGKVTSSVTNKTSYLINNDLESNSTKNKKATELNIPIINEESFLEMFTFN